MPFGKSFLKKIFEETKLQPGNRRTPNVAIYFFHKTPYQPKFGPIIRMIVDMGDDTRILAAGDTGIEQRPFKGHHNDMMDMFHAGLYIDMHTPVQGSKWPSNEPILNIIANKTTQELNVDL